MTTKNFIVSVASGVLCLVSPLLAGGRTTQQIFADIAVMDEKIEHICQSDQLLDPKYREPITPILKPLLQQRQALYAEWQAAQPKPDASRDFLITRNEAELAYVNDDEATAALQKKAKSLDPAESAQGTAGVAMCDWYNAHGKAADQAAVLDRIAPLAAARPADSIIGLTLLNFINNDPVTPQLAARAGDLIISMKTPLAFKYKAKPDQLGKPLKIVGTTVAGKPFDISKWKGKVVMIDFWATWCPPCMAELPKVVELYNKSHAQGFEILGVSSDQSKPQFIAFLKEHPDVAWPQLCNGGAAWHPLTKLYGIDSIPRVYLIDRNGLLRSVTARDNLQEMIPKLLAEPIMEAATQPSTADHSPAN